MRPQLFTLVGVSYLYAIAAIAAIAIIWSWWALRRGRSLKDLAPGLIVAVVVCAGLLILWRLGRPLPIWSYGVMLMLAFAAGIAWAIHEARMRDLDADLVLDLAFFVLVGSIVGARLVHVILEFGDYRLHPRDIFLQWGWGLSFHGGMLGGVIAGLLFAHYRRVRFWTLADLAAPATALGYAIARVGCFLRGCCYGAPTSLPWAFRFPAAGADLAHRQAGLLTPPSHPTQLYSSAASLVIFALLLWLRRRLRVRGQLFLAYLAMYSVVRWCIEILRRPYTAQPIWHGAWLTEGQVASMVIFVAALAGMWILARREASAAASEREQVNTHHRGTRAGRS
jgi:phosphatidylglycerol:prolipoprotein diacylglycerol transferase